MHGYQPFTYNGQRRCEFNDIGLVHSNEITWCEELKIFICKECCIKRNGYQCVWWELCWEKRGER